MAACVTITYFHNMIGILTEIIGNPTPIDIPLVAEKQLPQGDWPMPIAPTTGTQKWHYRQSIEYELTNNRAMLDLASKYREIFLYNIYQMGRNSIEKGSRDTWTTVTLPKRINALEEAAAKMSARPGRGRRRSRRTAGGDAAAGGDLPAGAYYPVGGLGARVLPSEPLHQAIPSRSQAARSARSTLPFRPIRRDFATATEFVNSLLKNGITILKASSAFTVAGKNYPSGSYVVKTAQAFRPHIMDMFEPQDHPNDFAYPGGPPKPPYDSAGWTLAFQMGVKFDRILDGFERSVHEGRRALLLRRRPRLDYRDGHGGLSDQSSDQQFVRVDQSPVEGAGADVYWAERRICRPMGRTWEPVGFGCPHPRRRGPCSSGASRELGVPRSHAEAKAPVGDAMKLKPIRIGLYDQYGGNMPSGWTRWIFEQYEFPFQVVFPQTLDAGDLRSKFDVLVFTDGAFRRGGAGGRGGGGFGNAVPEDLPDEYNGWTGRISEDRTMPQLKKFAESGGSIVTVGSSTSMAELLGLPVKNYLVEKGPDGKERALPREKFYIPGSLLKTNIDNTNPLAYGMPSQVYRCVLRQTVRFFAWSRTRG